MSEQSLQDQIDGLARSIGRVEAMAQVRWPEREQAGAIKELSSRVEALEAELRGFSAGILERVEALEQSRVDDLMRQWFPDKGSFDSFVTGILKRVDELKQAESPPPQDECEHRNQLSDGKTTQCADCRKVLITPSPRKTAEQMVPADRSWHETAIAISIELYPNRHDPFHDEAAHVAETFAAQETAADKKRIAELEERLRLKSAGFDSLTRQLEEAKADVGLLLIAMHRDEMSRCWQITDRDMEFVSQPKHRARLKELLATVAPSTAKPTHSPSIPIVPEIDIKAMEGVYWSAHGIQNGAPIAPSLRAVLEARDRQWKEAQGRQT